MLSACKNEIDEIVNSDAEKTINAVKLDAKKSYSKIGVGADTSLDPPANNDVVINCHTSYSLNQGNSCVSVGGSLYRVSWLDIQDAGGGGSIRSFTSTKVASCSCQN